MSQVPVVAEEKSIYSLFGFGAVPKIKTGFPRLEDGVRTAYNAQISRDGIALSSSSSVKDYRALEARIVNSIGSNQDVGVAINEVSGKYADAMDYIKYLAESYIRYLPIGPIDSAKIENLKVALIKSLIKRIPDRAKGYIAESERGLYRRALRELKPKKRARK